MTQTTMRCRTDSTSLLHNTATCYNSSQCEFPKRCTLESSYRRYCSDTRFVTTIARTLFDHTGPQQPGAHGCLRCFSPVALLDFGLADELGTYQCDSRCQMSDNNGNGASAVTESYQTSNCHVACAFAPAQLFGSARLDRSTLFPGPEPSDRLRALRRAAVAAHKAARDARLAEVAAYGKATERAAALNGSAAIATELMRAIDVAKAKLEVTQSCHPPIRAMHRCWYCLLAV